jgi:hypothetical protein
LIRDDGTLRSFFARDAGRDGIVCYQRGTGQKNPRPADLWDELQLEVKFNSNLIIKKILAKIA